MGPAVSMSRRGWTPDTINAGDEIRAVGRPSRAPGTYGMCCAELTRPDGSSIRPLAGRPSPGRGSPVYCPRSTRSRVSRSVLMCHLPSIRSYVS